jgi:hypothetical protein
MYDIRSVISLTLGILFYAFWNYASNLISDRKQRWESCYTREGTELEKCEEAKRQKDQKWFMSMIFSGVAGLIIGVLIWGRYPEVALGLGIGGLLCVVFGIFDQWYTFSDNTRLIILASMFVVVAFVAQWMFKGRGMYVPLR